MNLLPLFLFFSESALVNDINEADQKIQVILSKISQARNIETGVRDKGMMINQGIRGKNFYF